MAAFNYVTSKYNSSARRNLYVQLSDGNYEKIVNLRVKGNGRTGGIEDIPTARELKKRNLSLERVSETGTGSLRREDVTLAGTGVFEKVEQNSFVVFKSAKGSGSVKDPAMFATQVYDVKDILIPISIRYDNVPIKSLRAYLPNGEVRADLDLSELISLAGNRDTKFTFDVNGQENEVNLALDSFDTHSDVVPTSVSPDVRMMVEPSRIYEIDGHGKINPTPVGSSLALRELLRSGKKDFCFLDSNGEYRQINRLTEKAIDEASVAEDSNAEGRYIFVRLKGDTAHTVCPIENLRQDDGHGEISEQKINAHELASFIGKKIWALGEGGQPYELEPLLAADTVPYEPRKSYYETFSAEDVCKDENDPSKPQATAMLRLKNGNYVKEADVVQPKCYNFVDDAATTNYDAYLVTIGKGDFARSFVVDKSRIDHSTGDTIRLALDTENIEFKKADARKVVKSRGGINNSDIIQTSSIKGTAASKCEVLNTKKEGVKLLDGTLDDEKKQELAERIKKIYADFLEKYKARQYDLGGELLVMDDAKQEGEFEEYLENHRYMLADIVPMQDSAVNHLKELLNMPEDGFVFDGEKLVGGAKYDYKKGVKNSFNKLGDFVSNALSFTFTGGSLLVLAFPFLVPAFVLGVVGASIGIPLYHSRKKMKIEAKKNYEYKNKIEHQSETIKDEIFAQIEQIVEDFKDKQPEFEKSLAELSPEEREQKIQERKQLFLAEIALEETKIDLLSASKSGAQFDMLNGKGRVNQANAHEYTQYVKLVEQRKSEIENLSKEIKTSATRISQLQGLESLTPEQKTELDNLVVQRQTNINKLQVKNNELADMRKNYRITGADNHPDKEQQAIRDRIDQAKGFMLVKYFGESAFDRPDEKLTAAEKAQKKQIEEFVKATDIFVDKHKRDFEYLRTETNDKTQKISRKDWKKRKKAFVAGGLFSRLRRKGKGSKFAAKTVSTASAISAISAMRAPEVTAEETAEVAPEVTAEAAAEPVVVSKPTKARKLARSLTGLTQVDVQNIIEEVCRAMEELQQLTTSRGVYGANDLSEENEVRANELKEKFEYNKNILKSVINSNGKFHKALYGRYAADINKAGLKYKEYMSIVENKTVRL